MRFTDRRHAGRALAQWLRAPTGTATAPSDTSGPSSASGPTSTTAPSDTPAASGTSSGTSDAPDTAAWPYGAADPLVLALPRGGVPVAAEVAREFRAPLDVLVARKIGVPGSPETGIGALVGEEQPVFDQRALRFLGLAEDGLAPSAEADAPNCTGGRTSTARAAPSPAFPGGPYSSSTTAWRPA